MKEMGGVNGGDRDDDAKETYDKVGRRKILRAQKSAFF